MSEGLRIQTSINSNYLKSSLFRGFFKALLGILGLVITGVFLPEPLMQQWGWIICLISFIFIAWGLFPYRSLNRLQIHPNEIRINSNNSLEFWSRKHCRLELPIQTIQSCSFIEDKKNYGIRLQLKDGLPSMADNLRHHQVLIDHVQNRLTFLFFTKRSYQELVHCQD